jgi:hypothetical protein
MNIIYNIDKFLRPSYQIVGAGIEWAIILLITFLVLYINWRLWLRSLWRRTWLWQWIDFLMVYFIFNSAKRKNQRQRVERYISWTRDHIQWRKDNNKRGLVMEKYYERMFAKTEKQYAEEPGR